ncbi:MAG: LacI family DNA-binding transcriptional regulator, partial [Lentisphaeria bacterium]|nr:LacI family DNA-binding transcriptional regulator [Lentisphaeria bacterium]
MKKNGLKQIALTAGCSCSTVSRVLNNRNNISEPT